MIKKILYALLAVIIYSSCSDSNDNPDPRIIDPLEKSSKRTVLIYIAGANSLGGTSWDTRFDIDDMKEMLQGMDQVSSRDLLNTNILVFHQPYRGDFNNQNAPKREAAKLYRLTKDLKNNKGEFVAIKSYKDTDISTDEVFMGQVFKEVYTDYPADSYGLVVWSHADGWLEGSPSPRTRWIGEDKYNGTSYKMDILDFKKALGKAPYLDFIHFDLCLMQTVEVAYEMQGEAHYTFGSPAEIPGPGSPYDKMIPIYFSANKHIVNKLAKTYYDYYEKDYTGTSVGNYPWQGGVSMSIFDITKVGTFAEATRDLLANQSVFYDDLKYQHAFYYDPRPNGKHYYSDIIDLLEKSNVEITVDWMAAYNDFVPYFETTAKNYSGVDRRDFSMAGSHGVSMYIPRNDNPRFTTEDIYYKELPWYKFISQ